MDKAGLQSAKGFLQRPALSLCSIARGLHQQIPGDNIICQGACLRFDRIRHLLGHILTAIADANVPSGHIGYPGISPSLLGESSM